MEEVPKLAKGRDVQELTELQRQGMNIQGDQQTDGLGSQDHSKVPAAAECHAGIWAAAKDGQQTRSVQAMAGASRLVNLVGETAEVPENEPPTLSDRYCRRREKLRW
jgi:hypothetical protein